MVETFGNTKEICRQTLVKEEYPHILYLYEDTECYFKRALSFLKDSITAGEPVLLVENERNYEKLKAELSSCFSAEEMKLVNYANSMRFYLSSGSYFPPAIESYFNEVAKPYIEENIRFRSWAHVEWSTINGSAHLVEQLERIIDQAVKQYSFSLVCAYERSRTSDELMEALLQTHPYIANGDSVITSDTYRSNSEKNV